MHTSTQAVTSAPPPPPDERISVAHPFRVAGQVVGGITVFFSDDGTTSEVQISMPEGSEMLCTLLGDVSRAITDNLRADQALHRQEQRFQTLFADLDELSARDPDIDPDIRQFHQVVEYVLPWLKEKFGTTGGREEMFQIGRQAQLASLEGKSKSTRSCPKCGRGMQPSGTCFACSYCGEMTDCSEI